MRFRYILVEDFLACYSKRDGLKNVKLQKNVLKSLKSLVQSCVGCAFFVCVSQFYLIFYCCQASSNMCRKNKGNGSQRSNPQRLRMKSSLERVTSVLLMKL